MEIYRCPMPEKGESKMATTMEKQREYDKKVQERRAENKRIAAEKKKAKRLKKAYKKEAGLKWYEKAPKEVKEKAEKKSKAKETGEVRRGAKGVKSTKGGEYVKYKKKSKAAKSFRKAFADAEGKDFIWDGRKYSGKKAAPKKAAVKKAPAKAKTFGKEGLKKKAQEASKSRISTPDAKKQIAEVTKQAEKIVPEEPVEKKMAEGGKVEGGGLFNWPSRDARNGGNK